MKPCAICGHMVMVMVAGFGGGGHEPHCARRKGEMPSPITGMPVDPAPRPCASERRRWFWPFDKCGPEGRFHTSGIEVLK